MEDIKMKVSTVETNDVGVGDNTEKEYRSIDALQVYDEETKTTERPQLIREYLTEMLESQTHQWYYIKDRKKRLDDIKCIVRVLEMLEE